MIKGVIITHGNLGKEMVQVAETILEKKTDVDYISLDWSEDGTRMFNKLENYIKKNQNDRTIIFTDMFGGSPTNICYKFKSRDIEIITGVNLPGLLKFLTHREKEIPFKELVKIIKKGAIDDINIISEYLGEKRA